jgi:hypothetical protein
MIIKDEYHEKGYPDYTVFVPGYPEATNKSG